MRSVLLTAASNAAIGRSRSSSAITSATGSTRRRRGSRAGPCPRRTGPRGGRSAGTMFQPVAADASNAATSRRASVPSGKSSRGRSPRRACRRRPPRGRGPGRSAASRGTAARCWSTRRAGRRRTARRGEQVQRDVHGEDRHRKAEVVDRRRAGARPRPIRRRAGVVVSSSSSGSPIERRARAGCVVSPIVHRRAAQFSRWPLRRGQRWPCGSSGWPHSGHGGRPAASTRSARPTKARAASGRDPDAQEVRPLLVVVVEGLLLARPPRRPRRPRGPRAGRGRRACPSPATACPPGTPR